MKFLAGKKKMYIYVLEHMCIGVCERQVLTPCHIFVKIDVSTNILNPKDSICFNFCQLTLNRNLL